MTADAAYQTYDGSDHLACEPRVQEVNEVTGEGSLGHLELRQSNPHAVQCDPEADACAQEVAGPLPLPVSSL